MVVAALVVLYSTALYICGLTCYVCVCIFASGRRVCAFNYSMEIDEIVCPAAHARAFSNVLQL